MLRKLQTKHYVENEFEKIGKAPVETRRVGKENQLPPRAKTPLGSLFCDPQNVYGTL